MNGQRVCVGHVKRVPLNDSLIMNTEHYYSHTLQDMINDSTVVSGPSCCVCVHIDGPCGGGGGR